MLQLKIDSNLHVESGGIERILRLKNQLVLAAITNTAINIVKKEAPVKSGIFKNSIKNLNSRGTGPAADGSMQRFIRIGSDLYYKRYVINATKASPGAYVPRLDLRIRSGQHPGTRDNPMFIIARRRMRPKFIEILYKHFGDIGVQFGKTFT